jgi:uncharacterized protein (DUF2267 family)
MESTARENGETAPVTVRESAASEARARRHESRAGSTYAQFVRDVASAGGFTTVEGERYAIGTLTTLEERLPIRDVRALESQLPTRLDGILSFQPVLALPTMDRQTFCWRFAQRVGVRAEESEAIVRLVFRVLRSHISAGEARHIEAHLSNDLRPLWTGLAG